MGMTDSRFTRHSRAVGLFSSRQEAEQALHQLGDSGFQMDRVSVVAKSGEGLM